MRRGRPRRFQRCPECGSVGLLLYGVRKAGHCVSVYCECPACGAKLRYVSAGESGRWYRVRTIEDVRKD